MSVEPKDLKKLFDAKNAKTAAEAIEAKAKMAEKKAERDKRTEEGRAALRDVVIPYFKEIKAAFSKGEFSFDSAAKADLSDHSSVAVSFKVGKGPRHFIEVIQGNVKVFREGPSVEPSQVRKGGKKPPLLKVQFVFSPENEPFIAGPSDLTREKLSKLVEMAITGAS